MKLYPVKAVLFCLLIIGLCARAETVTNTETGELPVDEIRAFAEVFAKIKKDYVEDVEDSVLLEYAIRGMLEGLDPHSSYLDEEAYLDLQEGTTGEFGGLGIEVGMEDGFIKVISPIDDTPAQKAGLQAGDLIIRLDDTPVKGMSLNDAVARMRGEPGTDITLTIIRDGAEKPLKVTITRDVIKVKSVRTQVLEPGFGYLRISHFQSRTAEDARAALQELKQDNDGRLEGLILDLRNNPGGILSAAVGVSDLFLDKGLIVYTEGRIDDSRLRFNAKPADLLDNAPVVVLVNAGSASASEIVAGALQDHKRAIIMGQKTFGKGSVQTVLPVSNAAALKLTTARYFTPSGRSIQVSGIEPDVALVRVKVESLEDEEQSFITEENLSRHLDNNAEDEHQDGDGDEDEEAAETEQETTALLTEDYALQQALNVLKSLQILGSE
ncbi:MAG: S41 family peptidase [Gammaproteobacteria bacterium]|nr:S41 family peptidase [Gammaproteobacteria bacterium]MDE0284834.1 S41 family peptidase [Gammaproteobacteria bacterium]MDE0510289.1 S41 family peptidase [Gammaproteobacteria bacterium]